MVINDVALVLQGGAMRGNYTAGFLDVLLENDIFIKNVYGTSVGVLAGINYLAGNVGRTCRIANEHSNDKKFISISNYIKHGSIFNFDYLFHDVIKTIPFDEKEFLKKENHITMCSTDCRSGASIYFKNDNDIEKTYKYAEASCALPFACRIKKYDGIPCLDGALSDPIIYQKAIDDGFKKVIVVCTREKGFRKSKNPNKLLTFLCYPKYKEIRYAITHQKEHYNKVVDRLESYNKSDGVFAVFPKESLKTKHTEKDLKKLRKIYELGRNDALKLLPEIKKFIYEQE